VTGVDIKPQPNYPFEFHQDDIELIDDRQIINIRNNYDAVAGSVPCQAYSITQSLSNGKHPMLIEYARWLFDEIDLPYVLENVPGAPLIDPVQVCGSALGLRVQRHRLFESNCDIRGTICRHAWQDRDRRYVKVPNGPGSRYRTGMVSVYGNGDGTHFNGMKQVDIWRHAMGIDWMTTGELAQAIPPAYTFHIGKQLIRNS
jgi:DNA (cytosine-5)-methyltransferase 1